MRISQMFPKDTVDAEDLAVAFPRGVVLTIEAIDYKTLTAKKAGQAEIIYFLRTRELRKPIKLNKTNGFAIADQLGEETDEWIGKTIRLLGIQMAVTDRSTGRRKKIWTFDVDAMKPTEAPSLPPGTDITGAAAQSRVLPQRQAAPLPQGGAGAAMGELTPIGSDKAADVAIALSERGRTLQDFAAHLATIGLGQLVEGKLPPAWPQAILPVARKYCSQTPKSAAPMSPSAAAQLKASWQPTEVVNRETGEVVTAGAPAPRLVGEGTLPPAQQGGDGYEPITDDDIPF